RRGAAGPAGASPEHLASAAEGVAAVARTHAVVLTHGNGPQVGLLALQAEAAGAEAPTPLDVLGAESEGLIGYLLAREVRSRLPGRPVTALLTQVEVDPDDPAFTSPDKPIGPVYDEGEARSLAHSRGWTVARDGDGWRRVVPSPAPRRLLEEDILRLLVEQGVLLICAGGGGIPVTLDAAGRVSGVEAVVDKDATAVLLARAVGAAGLLLLTDVPGVMEAWGTPDPRLVRRMTPAEARAFPAPEGSMAPKLRACADFVEGGGAFAVIGPLEQGPALLAGTAGTRIEAG
ncbi:MAG: carbamate kinase, partial [Longimicrobiales bacterium]|nr:carbamate kinase [Longimicrobiales bacterium]